MHTARRRRLSAALAPALGLALVLALLAGATVSSRPTRDGTITSASTSASAASLRCGGSRTLRVGNHTWTCSFDDEFSGGSLNASKWSPQTTRSSGWTTTDTCYVNRKSTIYVGGGSLHLVARKLGRSMSCGGAWRTRHLGGALMTRGHFSQTYGRFQIRARFPATRKAGFWGDLWLYPRGLTYGKWPRSGEIDIAEHWSGHGNQMFSSLHYKGSGRADTKNCFIGADKFHTYVVQWYQRSMSFYRDGQRCLTRNWTKRTGSTHPFDKPFFVMLSEGFGDPAHPVSRSLPRSGPVVVDYVRVYR